MINSSVYHTYNTPEVSAADWKLEVIGKVEQPLTLTLNDIKGRQKQNVIYTLECSGNHGFPTFIGPIGAAKWSGTPLASIVGRGRYPEGWYRSGFLRQ